MINHLCIVVPLYNDWISFRMLLERLDEEAARCPFAITVRAVDDGSVEPVEALLDHMPALAHLARVELIQLAVNVGHQRAIAVGLCTTVDLDDADAIAIMDGDGEDPPAAIATLLDHARGKPDFCVVAQRRRRTEDLTFKLSYVLYKTVFFAVTGRRISFGNFSVVSRGYAKRLVMVSELWNNLPAAVLRSKIPFERVPVDRGYRYAGRSKMNFVSLVVHGLSGISVYADAIFVRLLLLAATLVALTVATVVTVLTLRLFYPSHATPGWATTVSFGMFIIFLQVALTALSSSLLLLNSRVQRQILPLMEYKPYILRHRVIASSQTQLPLGQPQKETLQESWETAPRIA